MTPRSSGVINADVLAGRHPARVAVAEASLDAMRQVLDKLGGPPQARRPAPLRLTPGCQMHGAGHRLAADSRQHLVLKIEADRR